MSRVKKAIWFVISGWGDCIHEDTSKGRGLVYIALITVPVLAILTLPAILVNVVKPPPERNTHAMHVRR